MKYSFIILLLFLYTNIFAQEAVNTLLKNGNAQYKQNDYANAAKNYEQANMQQPQNMPALFNLGLANYKMNDLKKAADCFTKIIDQSTDKQLKEKSYYNLGVIAFRNQQLQAAATSFRNALKLDEKDEQSRDNLQLVLNKIKEQSIQKPKEKQQPDQKQSILNKQSSEQLLDQLSRREKQLRDSLNAANRVAAKKEASDW